MRPTLNTPYFSVVVPVHNGAETLDRSLDAIRASSFTDFELIVVDDGSTDGSAEIAADAGAKVLHTQGRLGPGSARNLGVSEASGEFIVFIDADCSPAPDALQLAAHTLRKNPEIDALFGSYDDSPSALGLVSRFKNLQHHYVHQTGSTEASTFWAGCGVIRRSTFRELGGFDTKKYPRPSIEDIELGYRLRAVGGRIRLASQVQVKHHKAWSLAGVLRTDLIDRGIPWTRLLMEQDQVANDLNLGFKARASVVLASSMLVGLVMALIWPRALVLSAGAGLVLVWLNFGFYRLLTSRGGLPLLASGLVLHWVYQLNCALAFVIGRLRPGSRNQDPT